MNAQLYIADISGFSRFVNETEILHGQEIIAEPLESIIDSNKLEMEIDEIEGDAIVFYSFNTNFQPSLIHDVSSEILKQFKERREIIIQKRICECGACKGVANLTLKFIVHKDEIKKIKVKNFAKLYGRGLIIAHLLLKNEIPSNEYLLFTEDYLEEHRSEILSTLVPYTHRTMNIGNIKTKYIEFNFD
jgi:hypothetical protein